MNDDKTNDTCVNVSTPRVVPEQPRNDGGNDETTDEDELQVPPVLPSDDGVLGEITDICGTGLSARLDKHPTDVGPVETLVGVVWVKVGVGVSVVSTVTSGPPFDRAFDCTRSGHCEEVLQRLGRVVRAMSPETMVPCGDTCSTRT